MEVAISTRLERVVEEIVAVRSRAQALSVALEQARAEHQELQTLLASERAALATTHSTLEGERAQLQAERERAAVTPAPLPEPILEQQQPFVVAEVAPEPVTPVETAAIEPATVTPPASRLPSPKKLLSKLKFGSRKEAPLPEALVEAEPAPTQAEPEPIEAPVPPTPVATAKKKSSPQRIAPREFLVGLPRLTDEQLDLATFGIVQLADDGRCIAINARAVEQLGITAGDAIDQLFFETLLPSPEASARFAEGIARKKLDTLLYLEDYALHLFRHAKTSTSWALLRREEGDA